MSQTQHKVLCRCPVCFNLFTLLDSNDSGGCSGEFLRLLDVVSEQCVHLTVQEAVS